MAQAVETGSSGKRTLVTDVNLIPFIDLLSVCICFLLMTAVWVQLGVLEIKQTQGTSASVGKDGFEIGVVLLDTQSVRMELKKNGRVIKKQKITGATLDVLQSSIEKVTQKFHSMSKKQVSSAILTPHRTVSYGHLVAVMDTLRRNKVTNLGVLAIGGAK